MITQEDINKAKRQNIAINKALQIEKAKNEARKNKPPTEKEVQQLKASKNRKFDSPL